MSRPTVDLRELDLRTLDRRSLAAVDRAVSAVRPEHLDLPTPCSGWRLRDLLWHLVSENRGFAANSVGLPVDRSVWQRAELGPDPCQAYRDSAALVTAAFSAADLYDRQVEVGQYGTFSGRVAISLHVVDYLVHAWDVARAVGIDPELDEDLCDTALRIAHRWPYQRPDAAFDVLVEVPEAAPAADRLMGYLGRSPAWPS
ncbi:MAG TPA: TIGR03086 family metal-binding protein [Micromonospora sp.]